MQKELMEKRNDLITIAEDVLNTAKTEKRELTETEAQELTQIKEDVSKIDQTLKLDEEFRAIDKMEVKDDNTPMEEEVEMTEEEKVRAIAVEEEHAFENFLRGKVVHERTGELSPAVYDSDHPSAGAGGALIPETILNRVIRKVYNICPVLEKSQKFNVKGKLEVPFYPADSNKITVAYQNEFSPLSSSSGSFDTVELGGFLAGALTKVSRSLINNVEFDIVGFVVDQMAQDIARFIEHELLVGTSQKVEGLSTLSNSVTASSASAITLNDIINVHDAIKDQFQQNAIWIMSSATRTALRKLTSNTGYPLLNDDVSTPFGTSLLGKPVYVSDNMPEIATKNAVIYYGDMAGLGTKFAEEITIDVLRERFADEHAVGVIGWFEFDAKVIDEQQIAVLKMA